jgi:hypothetical protein
LVEVVRAEIVSFAIPPDEAVRRAAVRHANELRDTGCRETHAGENHERGIQEEP